MINIWFIIKTGYKSQKMRFHSELFHIDSTRCIVGVSAWNGDIPLGNALGESNNIIEAENQALSRLLERLKQYQNYNLIPLEQESPLKVDPSTNKKQDAIDSSKNNVDRDSKIFNHKKDRENKINNNPRDWSNDLALIDIELKRLNWGKEDENKLISMLFNYGQRNKIIHYKEIQLYLEILKSLEKGQSVKDIDLNSCRPFLKQQTDNYINLLNWSESKARASLYEKYGYQSRSELNLSELYKYSQYLRSCLSSNSKEMN